MKKINSFKNTRPIIFTFITALALNLLMVAAKMIYLFFGILQGNENIDFFIREITVTAICLFLVFITNQQHIYKCGTKGLLKGLWSGFFIIAISVFGCFAYMRGAIITGREFKPAYEIVAYLIMLILVGIAEESVCRGIITDVLLKHFGKTKGGILLTVLLSAVIFGCSHIINIFRQSVEETIVQIVATSLSGILLGAIYVKHQNIYSLMIIHSIFDLMATTPQGFFAGSSLASSNASYEFDLLPALIQAVISQAVFVIIAAIILSPKTLKRLANENSNKHKNGSTE